MKKELLAIDKKFHYFGESVSPLSNGKIPSCLLSDMGFGEIFDNSIISSSRVMCKSLQEVLTFKYWVIMRQMPLWGHTNICSEISIITEFSIRFITFLDTYV